MKNYVFNKKLSVGKTNEYEISWEEVSETGAVVSEICKTTTKIDGPQEEVDAAIILAAKQLRNDFSERFIEDTETELHMMEEGVMQYVNN